MVINSPSFVIYNYEGKPTMNRDLLKYIGKHGDEKISNSHLIFINGLILKSNEDFGYLYKLSSRLYRALKNKEDKTLNEVINFFNNKK